MLSRASSSYHSPTASPRSPDVPTLPWMLPTRQAPHVQRQAYQCRMRMWMSTWQTETHERHLRCVDKSIVSFQSSPTSAPEPHVPRRGRTHGKHWLRCDQVFARVRLAVADKFNLKKIFVRLFKFTGEG